MDFLAISGSVVAWVSASVASADGSLFKDQVAPILAQLFL